LVIPDGFNYEVASRFDLEWKVINFPANQVLLGEVFVEGKLFTKVILTEPETIVSIDIPLHYNEVQMNVHSDEETLSKTFSKSELLVFEANFSAQLGARSVANSAMKMDKEDTDGDGVKDSFDWAPEDPGG